MRFEYQRHDKGKDDSCRNARAGCRQCTRERLKQPLLRTAHRAVGKQIAEARNRHRCACAGKLHKRLIDAERRQHDSAQHKQYENLARSQIGKIDDELRKCAYQPSYRKRLYKRQNYFKNPYFASRSSTTACAMQGILSPCPEVTVESNAPVATNNIRFKLPVIIFE